MQKYTMHNYKQNIHIGDVKSIKSKRRAVNGEDEVQEICEVVEENGISMKSFCEDVEKWCEIGEYKRHMCM